MNPPNRTNIAYGPIAASFASVFSQLRTAESALIGWFPWVAMSELDRSDMRRLITIWLGLENEAFLLRPFSRLEQAATDVQAEFEGHVQAIVFARLLRLDSGQVMNCVFRTLDQGDDLVDARPAGIQRLERYARAEAKIDDGEEDRSKQGQIRAVERAIDENVGFEWHRA